MYEYRAPLVYVEPAAEPEAVDTPPKKRTHLPLSRTF